LNFKRGTIAYLCRARMLATSGVSDLIV